MKENPELLRASVFHSPENAFHSGSALRAFTDGGLVVSRGQILACGDYSQVHELYPHATIRDLRGSFVLPGFVDTHIHFPQIRILAGLGHSLLDWLELLTLPEEARFADAAYAATVAEEFVRCLAANGTTTALVFGSHFVEATAALFEAASCAGLRVISGLVLADRLLRPELHSTPDQAWRGCHELISRVRGEARLGYAVIPRFALSASEPMLEVCQALFKEDETLHFTSHLNESPREIETVASLFPWARDYLDVYEKYDLIGRRSVLAHNLHAKDSEIDRLAAHAAAISHCPCSNAALGSGFFPMRRHLDRNARFAMGTDVGGGTGFGIMKEALQAHLLQRLAPDPMTITPAQMLYLATRAGAEALGMEATIGDFAPGKHADYVVIRPDEKGPLAAVLKSEPEPSRTLGRSRSAKFTWKANWSMTVTALNDLRREVFVAAIGHVCEDSPWVAERAWLRRPFGSLADLCAGMNSEIAAAPRKDQLALLRAHPDLGTRARIGDSSTREQAGAGLDHLTRYEYDRLLRLNATYRAKFGFPFLHAVKGSDKHKILEALEARLNSDEANEFAEALRQVGRIVRFRLEEIIE